VTRTVAESSATESSTRETLTAEAIVATPSPPVSRTVEQTVAPRRETYPGWVSYTNDTYGFAFQYPASWSLQEVPSDGVRAGSVVLRWETVKLVIQ
jgi:hypothetical protein